MTAPGRVPGGTQDMSRAMSDAGICRAMGWGPGTRIVGDEGFGPRVIEITAVGERNVLAKTDENVRSREGTWTLSCRDWTEATS